MNTGSMFNLRCNNGTGAGFIFRKAETWGWDDISEVCL